MPRVFGGKVAKQTSKKGKVDLASDNTVCYLQVLGLGTDYEDDAVPSILLFFDRQRYLFNAGEGFQRFCVEHKVRMNRVSSCLLTRLSADASGGIPGMCLTMAEASGGSAPAEKPQLGLIGPQGVKALANGSRSFINPTAIGLSVLEFAFSDGPNQELENSQKDPEPVVANDLLTITPVLLSPGSSSSETSEHSDPAGPAKKARLEESSGAHPMRSDLAACSPPEQPAAACYVCELTQVPGKFLPQKAIALGVPKGPLFATLKRGEAVTLENGNVVEAHLVNEPPHPGPVAVIVDCPDETYLPSLSGASVWQTRFRQTSEEAENPDSTAPRAVDVICHLASAEIVQRRDYQDWVAKFGDETTHIFVNATATRAAPVMTSSALLQARLNCVHPRIFPLHHGTRSCGSSDAQDCPPQPPGRESHGTQAQHNSSVADAATGGDVTLREASDIEALHAGGADFSTEGAFARSQDGPQKSLEPFRTNSQFHAAQNLLKFHLRPPRRRGCFDLGEVPPPIDFNAAQEKVTEVEACTQQASSSGRETGGASQSAKALLQQLGSKNLELVFLGTGAAIPAKYRNVTGVYLDFFHRGGMLVDCGEGSYSQLKRKYGPRAGDIVAHLQCIWISHIHADHHAGITRILALRRRLLGPDCNPLVVFGPRALHRVLHAYAQVQPLGYHFIDCSTTVSGHGNQKQGVDMAAETAALQALGISRLQSFTVEHCANAYGLLLESKDGWKIVFSGDTRPCNHVVQAAKDALILIHEATFEDALIEEAVNKRHSTSREAVEVGCKANAYRTILTHFSQRYPKIPVIDSCFQATTCIAFDLMTVNLVDLPMLPSLVRPLEKLICNGGQGEIEEEEPLIALQDPELMSEEAPT